MAAIHASDILRCWIEVEERAGPATMAVGALEEATDGGEVVVSRGGVATDAGGVGGDGVMGGGGDGLWLWFVLGCVCSLKNREISVLELRDLSKIAI